MYIKVVPDELFWNNVRKCATRGFFAFLIPSQSIIVITLILKASENLADYALSFALRGFSLTTAVGMFVFCGTLAYLEEKEKRSKDYEEDG
jgi:hypothetical protein